MLLWSALLTLSCSSTSSVERVEPSFIYVSFQEGQELGTAQEPLDFTSEEVQFQVVVETLDMHGDPYPMEGDLTLDIRPGEVEQDPLVTIAAGRYEGSVTVRNGFGPTRIWFSDLGDKDIDSGRAPSFAAGVSEPIHYRLPTIAEVNRVDDHETNQFEKEFVNFRVEDRDVRVTAVGASGFWVSDLTDAHGDYNSLFIYTFSKPDDTVELGRRVTLLNGNDQEYLATTQISFPNYEIDVEGGESEVPEAALLDWSLCDDSESLEPWEGALVRIEAGSIPTTFVYDSNLAWEDQSEEVLDYLEYGQWPILSPEGDCSFYAESGTTVPGFFPTDYPGVEVEYVQGMLKEIWGKWILLPRGVEDIPSSLQGEGVARSAPSTTLRFKPPRKIQSSSTKVRP